LSFRGASRTRTPGPLSPRARRASCSRGYRRHPGRGGRNHGRAWRPRVEMPPQKVPRIQIQLADRARAKAKPVIVARQMLESMVDKPRPTRAEVSDVALAVRSGAASRPGSRSRGRGTDRTSRPRLRRSEPGRRDTLIAAREIPNRPLGLKRPAASSKASSPTPSSRLPAGRTPARGSFNYLSLQCI